MLSLSAAVDESEALVQSLLHSLLIAQRKLAGDQKRLADLEEWETMHANQELEKEGAKQTPDVPGVSAGRPGCDDTSENHLLRDLRQPPP